MNVKKLKINLNCLISFLLIFLLLLSPVSSQFGNFENRPNIPSQDNTNVDQGGVDQKAANTYKEKIETVTNHIKENYPQVDGSRGKLHVNSKGVIKFETPDGKTGMQIPPWARVKSEGGKLTFNGKVSGRGLSGNLNPSEVPLKLEGAEITPKGELPEVTFSKKDGVKTYEVNREEADLKIGDKEYKGVKDGKLEVNDKDEVTKADFKTNSKEKYEFKHKGQKFTYNRHEKDETTTLDDKKITFDPENDKISGENTKLDYESEDGKIDFTVEPKEGQDSEKKEEDKFKTPDPLSFDISLRNGEPTNVKLKQGGSFTADVNGESQKYSTGKETDISLKGEDISNKQNPSISINPDRKEIAIKGEVSADNLRGNLNYQGKSNDAFAKINLEDITKNNFPTVEVPNGDAAIDNGKHRLEIVDGKPNLHAKSGQDPNPKSFNFKSGEGYQGVIDEENNAFKLTAFKDGRENIVVEKPLDSLRDGTTQTTNQLLAEQAVKQSIQERLTTQIRNIDQEINQAGTFTQKEIQGRQLEKITAQNQLSRLNGEDSDSSIERLNNFLESKNLDSDVKAAAQNMLGERQLNRLAELKASYNSPLSNIEVSKAQEQFNNVKNYAEQQLKNPGLDDASREKYERLRDSASLNLATSNEPIKRGTASAQYERLIQDSRFNDIKSEASRRLGLNKLGNDLINLQDETLEDLQNAVKINPSNELAKADLQNYKANLANRVLQQSIDEPTRITEEDIIGNILGTEHGKYTRAYDAFFNHIRADDLSTTGAGELMRRQQLALDKNDQVRAGSASIGKLLENGIDPNSYFNKPGIGKLNDINKAVYPFYNSISQNEFGRYSEGLSFSEKSFYQDTQTLYDRIKSSRGEAVANNFINDFNKARGAMISMQEATKQNPLLYKLAESGGSLPFKFQGSQEQLNNAFESYRSTQGVERTSSDTQIAVTQFGSSLVGGVGLARGAIAGVGGAVGLATRSRAIGAATANAIRSTLAPAEFAATRLIKPGLSQTAAAFAGEFGLQIGASTALHASGYHEAAGVFDIVTLGGAAESRSFLKPQGLIDEFGNQRVLIPKSAVNPASVSDNLLAQGASRVSGADNLFRFSDGLTVQLADNVPDGWTKSFDANDVFDSRSFNIKQSAINAADAFRQTDVSSFNKGRIRSLDFTPQEFQRVERAQSVLSSSHPNEARLIENNPQSWSEIVLAARSGNSPSASSNFNPLSKFRPLRQQGFSPESIRTLASNNIFDPIPSVSRQADISTISSRQIAPTLPPQTATAQFDDIGANFWARTEGNPTANEARVKLVNELRRDVSISEFNDNLYRTYDQFDQQVLQDQTPYVRLRGSENAKSNNAVHELANHRLTNNLESEAQYFNRELETVVDNGKIYARQGSNLERYIKEDKAIFYPDDAYYSGEQFRDEFLVPIAEAYNNAGKRPTIYLATPYSTTQGTNNILSEARGYDVDLRVLSQENIPTIREQLSPAEFSALRESYRREFVQNPENFPEGFEMGGTSQTATSLPLKGAADHRSYDPRLKLFQDEFTPIYKDPSTDYYGRELADFDSYRNQLDQLPTTRSSVYDEVLETTTPRQTGPETTPALEDIPSTQQAAPPAQKLSPLISEGDKSITNKLPDFVDSPARTTTSTAQLTKNNIGDIARYKITGEGEATFFKGVVYEDFDGNIHTRFFKQGEDLIPSDVHHVHALNDVALEEGLALKQRAIDLGDDDLLRVAENKIGVARSGEETFTKIYTPENLQNAEGFQFRVENGRVTKIELNSGITNEKVDLGFVETGDKVSRYVEAVDNAIDPSLRGYDRIHVENLNSYPIDGEVNLPRDLKLVENRPEIYGEFQTQTRRFNEGTTDFFNYWAGTSDFKNSLFKLRGQSLANDIRQVSSISKSNGYSRFLIEADSATKIRNLDDYLTDSGGATKIQDNLYQFKDGTVVELNSRLPEGFSYEQTTGNLIDTTSNAIESSAIAAQARRQFSDVPLETIERIARGQFTPEEFARINRAQELLTGSDKALLDNLDNQKRLLLAHETGNYKFLGSEVNLRAKARLLEDFSPQGRRTLIENYIVGDNPGGVGLADSPSTSTEKLNPLLSKLDQNNYNTYSFSYEGVDEKVFVTDKITNDNFEDLFTHRYNTESNVLGAKAVAFKDFDGQIHVRFFQTGDNFLEGSIHHGHALNLMHKEEAENLLKRADILKDSDLARSANEQLTRANQLIASSEPRRPDISLDWVDRAEGFQFTLDPVTKKITQFDISSGTITAKKAEKGLPINGEEFSDFVRAVDDAIPENLKGYTDISIRDFEVYTFDSPPVMPRNLELKQPVTELWDFHDRLNPLFDRYKDLDFKNTPDFVRQKGNLFKVNKDYNIDTISRITSENGHDRFFIKAQTEEDVQGIKEYFLSKNFDNPQGNVFRNKISRRGGQVTEVLHGSEFEIGTKIPDGFKIEETSESLLKISKESIESASIAAQSRNQFVQTPIGRYLRINAGQFTPDEIARINRAQSLLSGNDKDLLDNPEIQKKVLISHYTGNYEFLGSEVNLRGKARLLEDFSPEGRRALFENYIVGTYTGRMDNIADIREVVSNTKSSSNQLGLVEVNARNDAGKIKRTISFRPDDLWAKEYVNTVGEPSGGWIVKHGESPILNKEGIRKDGFNNPEELVSRYIEAVGNVENPLTNPVYLKVVNQEGEVKYIRWGIEKKDKSYIVNFQHNTFRSSVESFGTVIDMTHLEYSRFPELQLN